MYYVFKYAAFKYVVLWLAVLCFSTVKHFVTCVCEKCYTNKVYLLPYLYMYLGVQVHAAEAAQVHQQ